MADDRVWMRPLSEILHLESAGEGAFAVQLPGFGGVTLGCATLAAARSCEGRSLHSLHSYFMRPVPTDRPVTLVVERLRDGRRFSHRRVQLLDSGHLHFELMASFAAPAPGNTYQETVLAEVPAPESVPSEAEIAAAEGWRQGEPGPLFGSLEWRWLEGTPWREPIPGTPSHYRGWVRPRVPLTDDPPLRAAAIALLSDYHSHYPAARRLGGPFEPWTYTSLDQVLWVHCDDAWDDWWLLASDSEVANGGRAMIRRRAFTRGGRLVATMMQEQLLPAAR